MVLKKWGQVKKFHAFLSNSNSKDQTLSCWVDKMLCSKVSLYMLTYRGKSSSNLELEWEEED